ncbi:putative MEMBRANE ACYLTRANSFERASE [Mycobacteroides abscessus 5S-1212]|uniref:Acyltransferase family protein n=1 Tax=Mycobacteroides abscessus subsp. bolletii 1513 TaxID=1299321 RepID=X8E1E5_9MYCO|nr:putative MEMBRANE ACYLTRANSFERASE [Mycobacteroides abscessus 5S-0817]EIU29771.1 putative MEMBRANE ACYLTRANSFERASE [Mycobacteroides abscessus 5S-1212]EUA73738.1 acyltransferase family protein [Mycobacteroides abscessus subsp. bolletii 1513]
MRGGEIKALTGLRIIAAFWVVLFHFRPLLEQAAPEFRTALNPILNCGAQGVDLFFILSGFVLTWNYLDRMGHRWSTRETLHFLWLRLARVWPVYLVTMHLAALWVIFTMHVGHVPERIDTFDATNYVRQLFMVQLWFRPYFDLSSWNGPAWSISAEWLAYLLFGGLVLVIFRMAHATRARSLMVLAVLASLPPVMLLLLTGQFYTPWSWLPRIVMQFTAGALACAAVSRLKLSHRSRHVAGYAALLIVASIVGALYFLDAHPISGVVDSRRSRGRAVRAAGDGAGRGYRPATDAALDPHHGLRRTDLLRLVHGPRARARLMDMGHQAVRTLAARPRRWVDRHRATRARGDPVHGVVPLGGGTRSTVDAAHDRRHQTCHHRSSRLA